MDVYGRRGDDQRDVKSGDLGGTPRSNMKGSSGSGGSGASIREEEKSDRIEEDTGPRLSWIKRSEASPLKSAVAKSGKRDRQTGWAHLPRSIHHMILSFACQSVHIPERLSDEWGPQTSGLRFIKTILNRNSMGELRLVCKSWQNNVDSHRFWIDYTILFYRDLPELSKDILEKSPIPTDPKFPTHFQRARGLTRRGCLACMIHFPESVPHGVTAKMGYMTTHLGFLPACDPQEFCTHCLKPGGSARCLPDGRVVANKDYAWDIAFLFPSNDGDIDETGEYRMMGRICADCRSQALRVEVESRLRTVCTHGGPIRGLGGYIWHGQGTVEDRADMTLDELFLIHHTHWTQLRQIALKLQSHEQSLREKWIDHNLPEPANQKLQRLHLLAQLNGEDTVTSDLRVIDSVDMRKMYDRWTHESHNGFTIDEEDDEEVDSDTKDRLTKRWLCKLRMGSINEWTLERIHLGYWVSPRDEIAQLAGLPVPPIHSAKAHIANSNTHPWADLLDSFIATPAEMWMEAPPDTWGWIDLSKYPQDETEPTLPSPALSKDLEEAFRDNLQITLSPALRQIVAMVQALAMDDGEAEAMCANWAFDDILSYLAKKETWLDGGLLLLRKEEIKVKAEERVRRQRNVGAPMGKSLIELLETSSDIEWESYRPTDSYAANEGITTDGPRIELVVDESLDVDYGITELPASSLSISVNPVTPDTPTVKEKGAGDTSGKGVASFGSSEAQDQGSALGKRKEAPSDAKQARDKRASSPVHTIGGVPVPGVQQTSKTNVNPVDRPEEQTRTRSASADYEVFDSINGTSETSSTTQILTPYAESVEVMDAPRKPLIELAEETTEDNDDTILTGTESPASTPLEPIQSESPSPTPELKSAAATTVIPFREIPWIPGVRGEELGPRVGKMVMEFWYEAREHLRLCHCTVCERRRKWDSWTET